MVLYLLLVLLHLTEIFKFSFFLFDIVDILPDLGFEISLGGIPLGLQVLLEVAVLGLTHGFLFFFLSLTFLTFGGNLKVALAST